SRRELRIVACLKMPQKSLSILFRVAVMRWFSPGLPVVFPNGLGKAMIVFLSGCCLGGLLTLTSCSGLSAQPAQQVRDLPRGTMRSPENFLERDRNFHSHLRLTGELPNATEQVSYRARILISGGTAPYRFSTIIGSLPPGLQLNRSTGEISGVPVIDGTYQFGILGRDSSNSAGARRFRITVQAATQSSSIGIAVSPSAATVASGNN